MAPLSEWLECQDCGDILNWGKPLTPEQQLEVARRPYDFVLYCRSCWKGRHEEIMGMGLDTGSEL